MGQIWSQVETLMFFEIWDVPWRISMATSSGPLLVAGLSHLGQHFELALIPQESGFADVEVVHSPLELHDPPCLLLQLNVRGSRLEFRG